MSFSHVARPSYWGSSELVAVRLPTHALHHRSPRAQAKQPNGSTLQARRIASLNGWWLVMLVSLLVPRAAAAQAALPKVLRILFEPCPALVETRDLTAQLRIETLAAGVVDVEDLQDNRKAPSSLRAEDDGEVATLRLSFAACDREQPELQLRIAHRQTGASAREQLDLADIPRSTRPRAVALAVVELLRAHWPSLAASPSNERVKPAGSAPEDARDEPAPIVVPARSTAPAKRKPSSAHWARVEWRGGARVFPSARAGLSSSVFLLAPALPQRLRVHLGAEAASGSDHRGTRLVAVVGRTGLGVATGDELVLEIDGLLDVGWASQRGADATDGHGWVTLASIQATLRSEVWADVDSLVSLYAGHVIRSLPATGRSDAGDRYGLFGAFLGLSVGLSCQL